jgi:hypothetical protein
MTTAGAFVQCVADGPTGNGFYGSNAAQTFYACLVRNATNSGKGWNTANRSVVRNCIAYNCASDGFHATGGEPRGIWSNNIAYLNGGYGYNWSSVTSSFDADYNAHGSNTSGATNNMPGGAGTHNITLTADPFVSASTGNFSLNMAAGGGLLLRGRSDIGAFPGLSSTISYQDIGAVQSRLQTASTFAFMERLREQFGLAPVPEPPNTAVQVAVIGGPLLILLLPWVWPRRRALDAAKANAEP